MVAVLQRSGPERAVPEGIASGALQALFCIQHDSTMTRLLRRPTLSHFGGDSALYYEWQARVYQLEGRGPEMRTYADSARRILERRVLGRPDDAGFHARLGLAYARLGRKGDAVREGEKATNLWPPSKDAWGGPGYILNLAEIQAILGDPDAAVEQLRRVLAQRGEIALTKTSLRYDSRFASLRNAPAFRQLVGN